jgi:hypothetical protein
MTAAQPQPEIQPNELPQPKWSLALRVAFRFCCIYFALFAFYDQIFISLFTAAFDVDIQNPSTFWPARQTVIWTAIHLFHGPSTLTYQDNGSGDKTFDWVLTFCLLVFSVLVTAAWSVLDRKRPNYITLHKWFRVFVRFALAGQMLLYGFVKAVPLQMPYPFLTRLLEPFGSFSPMGVLWSSIGASPAYETFTGCAEILGGLLLLAPRTTLLGALICAADLTQIFMLNMTYDVPVKLLSFHLLLLAVVLLAPDLPRMFMFFFSNRATEPAPPMDLFQTPRARRIALAAEVVFGLWLIGTNIYGAWQGWHLYGGGQEKSKLYGIWDVETLSLDSQLRAPLLTDKDRWRRAIFERPKNMTFQRIDGSFAGYGASLDVKRNSLTLTKGSDKNWKANFIFQRAAPDRLTLDGDMDKHKVHMELRLFDRNKFLLVNRGFHWVNEFPFNR